jgi:putative CocE/NonD family hydrolase
MIKPTALALSLALTVTTNAVAQDYKNYSPEALNRVLARDADAHLGVLTPMRDGIGLSTDVYIPKAAKGPLPTILWKTPYNEHKLRGSTLRYAVEAVEHGYVFIVQNERGRYFSQGKYEILGKPQTDGYDALTWIAKQDWSNGKVGTLGCSSSAEWQLALAAQGHPAHAAMVPMSAGAGIGKVGRFQEQGNWYTGGVPRNLFFVWLYGVDNPLRAELPDGLSEAMRAHVEEYNDLDAAKPKIDWTKQIKHLPVDTLLSSLGEPPATFEQFIDRTPADPGWRQGGLYHDDMGWGVPALWFDAWYDVSIGPNLELFNHARKVGSGAAAANQYAIIAPTPHCSYDRLGPHMVVGERDMGDTSFAVDETIFAWFDRWLKVQPAAFPDSTPHVRYYVMGENVWKSDSQWPPAGVKTVRFYLRSSGHANSLYGDGRLELAAPPAAEPADRYRYDPMNPVQTVGGADCCNGGLVIPGAYDQRGVEARSDVLVYTSAPLTAPLEVSGFIDAVLKVSSSAKDTDFAVKLVDVAPDGTAWIIGDTILRARYRDGYDHPAPMQAGQVYTLKPTPITTSLEFGVGHRIRIEVTSSDFPKFERNLNTGGPNESESTPVIADNAIHHAAADASYIELPVVGGIDRSSK